MSITIRSGRRLTAVLIAAVAGLGGAAVAPTAAQAALPRCTKVVTYQEARVPAARNGSVNCTMRLGQRDSDFGGPVWRLQASLRYCTNNDGLYADGDYGQITEQVVSVIQELSDITVDGVYGPATRRAMKHMSAYGDEDRCLSVR